MKYRKWIAWLVLLLAAGSVQAGGGKQRGDEGQGTVVQTQVREVDPPAQWTASGSLTVTDERVVAEPSDEQSQAEEDGLF